MSDRYLLRSVRNRCLNYLRGLSTRERVLEGYSLNEKEIDEDQWPDDETIAAIHATVANDLTEACRRVVELRFRDGKSYKEIAGLLGVTEVAVYKHFVMRLMFYVQNYLEMDKIDRLLEAMEHPDRYSENDVEAMLADPEVREVYDLLDKTSATFRPMPDPDVEAEWTAFKRSRNRRGRWLTYWVSRNVAAGVAIGLASLAALAAVVVAGVGHVFDKRVDALSVGTVVAEDECVIPDDVTVVAADTTVLAPEIIIFDNDSLEEIVSRVAGYHGDEVGGAGTGSSAILK